ARCSRIVSFGGTAVRSCAAWAAPAASASSAAVTMARTPGMLETPPVVLSFVRPRAGKSPARQRLPKESEMAIDVAAGPERKGRSRLRVAPAPAPSREAEFDRAYWLAHCEGFRVDGHAGRIGFVDEVRP